MNSTRSKALPALGIFLTGLASALALWWPMFKTEHSGWGDWQQFHHWWEVGVVSMRRFGEWPLWDPYHCGGVSQWGQPQAQNFSPFYLITALPFGTTLGHKLFLLIHHAIAWSGAYVVGRKHERCSPAGAFLAATIWTSSGVAAWDGAGGHSTFLAFAWLPWLLFGWREADKDIRYTVLVAAVMTEILLEGGTYPLPFSVIVMAFDTLTRVHRKNVKLVVRTGVVSVFLTLFLAAARWMPIYIAMSRHPRVADDDDAIRFMEIVEMWTARTHDWTWAGHHWVWAEYGSYVGWAALFLATLGIFAATSDGMRESTMRRQRFALIAGFVLFLAFSMGSHAPYWPFPLIAQRLPGIGNLRVPSRWQVVCTLYLGWLAGVALTHFEGWLSRKRFERGTQWIKPIAPFVIAMAISIDIVATSIGVTDRWDGGPVGTAEREAPHLVAAYNYLGEYANYPVRDVSTMECYDNVPWHRATSLWVGQVPQVRIVDADAEHPGTAFQTRSADRLHSYWRTNYTAGADVELATPGRVIFNQNYESQWHASVGTVVSDDLRLAVDLPAGRHRVRVRFEPDDMPYSLVMSGLGVLFSMAVLVIGRRRALA